MAGVTVKSRKTGRKNPMESLRIMASNVTSARHERGDPPSTRTMYDSSSHARRARRLTDKIMAKKKAMRDK
tara:strand:- start:1956 stop:2168 length:213 start_codon:yes stop_codon:yes gene_type:complete